MGMYMFISEDQRKAFRSVKNTEINRVFQEAIAFCPGLLIEQHNSIKRIGGLLSSKTVENETFTIYHDEPAFDGSAYQARYQICGSGDKNIVFAYLYGIINGGLATIAKAALTNK